MALRVDPIYVRMTSPRSTDGGQGSLPSARDIFKDLSLTSQYKVSLHLNRSSEDNLDGHLTACGLFDDYSSSNYSYDFFAAEAILPGSNFDLSEQSANYQGMLEYVPYRRIFAPFEVTYYVDNNYNMLRIFEEWLNYANPLYGDRGQYQGGFNAQTDFQDSNSYYRMRYPEKYRRKITVTKFERSFWKNPNNPTDGQNNYPIISYQLIDAFPQQVTAVPLSYGGSDITKVSVTLSYTRYVTIKDNGDKVSYHARTNNANPVPRGSIVNKPYYGTYSHNFGTDTGDVQSDQVKKEISSKEVTKENPFPDRETLTLKEIIADGVVTDLELYKGMDNDQFYQFPIGDPSQFNTD